MIPFVTRRCVSRRVVGDRDEVTSALHVMYVSNIHSTPNPTFERRVPEIIPITWLTVVRK